MCCVEDFNLSYKSLTSPEARRALRNLPETDPTFFAELTQPRSRVLAPSLTPEEALDKDVEFSELDNPGDDVVVPLEAVWDVMAGAESDQFVPGEEWGLESAAEAEETMVEVVDGIKIDTTHAVKQLQGRGQRKRIRNKFYSDEAWVRTD